MGIGNKTFTPPDEELYHTPQHQQAGHDITATGDQVAQTVKLLGKRCLNIIINLCVTIDFSVLGLVAHTIDTHRGTALDDGAGSQQHGGWIGRLGRRRGSLDVMRFPCRWLAGERALINREVETVDDGAVGRDLLTCLQNHDVTHHDVTTRHLCHMARTHHFDLDVVI